MFLGCDRQTIKIKQGMVKTYNNNNNNNPSLSLYIVADVVKESPTIAELIINLVFTLIQKVLKDAESLLSH